MEEDTYLSELYQSLGPWGKDIVIGGGFALFIYKMYINESENGNFPIATTDIDSLISRKITSESATNIAKHLEDSGFSTRFKDRNIPATQSYIKEINSVEIEVEFLTDDLSRKNKGENVSIAGIVAQPLSYLELSIQNHIPFTTFSGYHGKVVTPEVWIFHKGLTFTKRRYHNKSLKDLYGIWYVSTQLNSLSTQTLENFKLLTLSYPRWFKTFKKNLDQWIKEASPRDWSALERQDPYGLLKHYNFEKIISILMD